MKLDEFCQRERFVDQQERVTRKKKLDVTGYAAAGSLALFSAASVVLAGVVVISWGTDGLFPAGLLLGLGLSPLYGLHKVYSGTQRTTRSNDPFSSTTHQLPPTLTDDGAVTTTNNGVQHVACNATIDLPILTLILPWGAKVTTTPVSGVATFTIDWSSESLATIAQTQPGLLADPWTIAVEKVSLTTSWKPTVESKSLAFELIKKAGSRVTVGATGSALKTDGLVAVGEGLQVGGSAKLRLSLENQGGTSAVDVTAKLRSGVSQLHGTVLQFGIIQPGKTVAREIDVTLPIDTDGDFATVIISFSETGGKAPPEITQKLPLKRALCPNGKLTREQYKKKIAKLKQAVIDGSLAQVEYDKLEADLVRCLED